MQGKQIKIRKLEMIDGMFIDEYIRENTDSWWLHKNEMREYIISDDNFL